MRPLARLVSLLRGLFGRDRMDRELDEELAGYEAELAARHEAAGLRPDEARRAARRAMGGLPEVKAAVRESWLASSWDAAFQDVRQAWRGLRATPGVSAVAVLTFALGIGAAAAILGVVQATLLTPPPYREPSRLLLIWADLSAAGHPRAPLSGPELGDLRTRTATLESVGGIWANSITLQHAGEAEFIRIGLVTANFFDVLGVRPAAGRLFAPQDEVDGAPVIVLSDRLWQRRFGADPKVVGQRITVNERPVLVAGVLPPDFGLRLPHDSGIPDSVEAYQPFWPHLVEGPRGQRFLRVLARMKPGATLAAARHDVDRLAAQLTREIPGPRGTAFHTHALEADATRAVRGPLLVVAASVGLLLVIAAVNVLGVLIARAAARRREIAVRVALGASLGRVLRLALAEGLTLAFLGALVGVAVAHAVLAALVSLQPEALRRLGSVSLDGRVLAWTAALAAAWGVLFALVPLRQYARGDVASSLQAARGASPRLRPKTRSALVVAQAALTLVLLASALLLTRTFARLLAIDPGFRAEHVLTFRVPSATTRYPTPEARDALARMLAARLRALPSVTSVGAASHLPYDSIPNWGGPFSASEANDQSLPSADYRSVGPGFFETAGIALVAGRAFSEDDGPGKPRVAVVDERLARRVWPDRPALGQRLFVDPASNGFPDTWVTVVGVARHVRHRSLVAPLNEQVYFPLSQAFRNPVAYLLRTSAEPAELAPAVRAAVRELDPSLPIYETQPLAAYLERARGVQRFTMLLVAVFAVLALLLSAIGLYGVIAYSVVQRRREFGVRMALGASRADIGRLVLLEATSLLATGAALGLAIALATGPLLRAQLFGVSPTDAVALLAPVPIVGLVALSACLWPAHRATRASVVDVLRAE